MVPGLSASSSSGSDQSTSRTLSIHESHYSTSLQARLRPPTVTSSDNKTREREDRIESDTSSVPVSTDVDDRSGQPVVNQANQNPKPSKKAPKIERDDPMCSEIPEWLQEFTGANDSVENYAGLFTIGLRNDDIQEFDSKWDGILLSMAKIPSDDVLEGLYKLRIRESEKLKTVLELYDLETHQKKIGPDYHRLKTMVKRSIEQDLRIRNFGARNGNYEGNAVVKNQGTKQRGQRFRGDCWQWEANGQFF